MKFNTSLSALTGTSYWRFMASGTVLPLPEHVGRERHIAVRLLEWAAMDLAEALRLLKTSERGLSTSQARELLAHYGPNVISRERPHGWLRMLLGNFRNPFIILLCALAVVSFFLFDLKAVLVLSVMVTISVLMRFVLEYRSAKASEKLKSLVQTTATVIRRRTETHHGVVASFDPAVADAKNEQYEIPLGELVPGDIIHLSAGDMIPADVRLISARDLFVNQSALTGESLPVEKFDTVRAAYWKRMASEGKGLATPLDLPNIAFMGTNVISGTAIAVVLTTGEDTYFDTLARTLGGERAKTAFDRGVNSVSGILIRFSLVMMPLVLLLNGFAKGNWMSATLFALSVGVGLTPEMLPMIVTASLALGAVRLSRKKVIVKRLSSIQNLGGIDVLCTDKTGTLTQDRVVLARALDLEGNEDDQVLEYAYLNSYYQSGLKNLLDEAVLDHAGLETTKDIALRFFKTDEIPFDFGRRRMSVAVHEAFTGRDLLISKGAVEEILAVATHARMNGAIVSIEALEKDRALSLCDKLNREGLRVIAVAYRELASDIHKPRSVVDERDMILAGYIAFLDPPKQSAAAAIKALRQDGVNVKILTGDNEAVARSVCNWVDIEVHTALQGSEIDATNDEHLPGLVEKTDVFVKMTPLQKARVVRALQSGSHTVGFLGDGINDSAALRDADVGISVNGAVDIAKESADIVLLEKDLMVIEEGVITGRRMFGNITKYIKMAASSNFGNVLSVLGTSVFLPFLPMLPIHLLIQNLLYDLSQTVIPFDNVDGEFVQRPQKWNAASITKFVLHIGPISSIFDYSTFAVMWFVFRASNVAQQSLFQSGWFIEGLLSQTLIVHLIRTRKVPFLNSWASLPVIVTTIAIMAVGMIIPFSSLGPVIGLVALPGSYFGWLVLTLFCYIVCTQIVKGWFIRKYDAWI